ncbi:MAG: aldo/keto reductase [Gemmatimonadales bacterium]|nr:aldo/keto reductase [Gemmatimonadales bacterium]
MPLPPILTGLWQLADMERDGRALDLDATAAAMLPYVDAGLTAFDMADHYGSAELVAGRFVTGAGAGRAVQLCTKWVPEPGPVTADAARAAVERALDRLRVPALDLLQYHAWTFADPHWLDALFHLDALRREGLVRALGVTNFDTAHLRIAVASGIPLVTNQVSCSVLDRRAAGRLAAYASAHGVGLLAYGTLAGGFLSDRWLGAPEPDWERLETWSQMKYGRFIRAAGGWAPFQALLRALDGVARRHGVALATVASRAALDMPGVASVIIGARLGQRAHVDATLGVLALRLDDADRAAIADAQAGLAPIPGDCGDEYRRPPFLTASGDLSHHVRAFPPAWPARRGHDDRTYVLSGTVWEPLAGYSRAVRRGDHISVSGTTATHGPRAIGGDDPAAQAHFVIDKIEASLRSLGGSLEDVVRTRIFVKDVRQWEPIARAHGERFGHILPANTMVQAPLIGEEYLVEIEAEAVVGAPR